MADGGDPGSDGEGGEIAPRKDRGEASYDRLELPLIGQPAKGGDEGVGYLSDLGGWQPQRRRRQAPRQDNQRTILILLADGGEEGEGGPGGFQPRRHALQRLRQ